MKRSQLKIAEISQCKTGENLKSNSAEIEHSKNYKTDMLKVEGFWGYGFVFPQLCSQRPCLAQSWVCMDKVGFHHLKSTPSWPLATSWRSGISLTTHSLPSLSKGNWFLAGYAGLCSRLISDLETRFSPPLLKVSDNQILGSYKDLTEEYTKGCWLWKIYSKKMSF